VIAATNRIEEIDEAAIRRFETRVHVDVPQESERAMLIANFLKPGHIEHRLFPADLKEIASWTQGWSGSDLESMVRDAAFAPVRRAFPIGYHEKVTMDADVDSNCDEDDQAEQSKWKLLVTLDDFKMAYDRATSHC
jgi:SpoVK/Ycf46/Vps4 family AAA+-type ATPase